jgi:hypothetical protein
MTRGTHTSAVAWALEHDFHVVNGRMVCNNDGEFAGFAPIWIDPVRHAVVVDVVEFGVMYQLDKQYLEQACTFFANACDVNDRLGRRFNALLWELED